MKIYQIKNAICFYVYSRNGDSFVYVCKNGLKSQINTKAWISVREVHVLHTDTGISWSTVNPSLQVTALLGTSILYHRTPKLNTVRMTISHLSSAYQLIPFHPCRIENRPVFEKAWHGWFLRHQRMDRVITNLSHSRMALSLETKHA